jgi:phospholipid transport system transporter-binding protein
MFQPGPALTLTHARSVLEAGLAAIAKGETSFDLGSLTELDSSAVAALLAWQRAARARGLTLTLSNLPVGLSSLASLYGVSELLSA